MLILANNGNWEKSVRTAIQKPEAHIDGGTMFLPLNIKETTVKTYTENEDGTVTEAEASGYAFDEYRVNRAIGLPDEAVDALAAAFSISVQALEILGVV